MSLLIRARVQNEGRIMSIQSANMTSHTTVVCLQGCSRAELSEVFTEHSTQIFVEFWVIEKRRK